MFYQFQLPETDPFMEKMEKDEESTNYGKLMFQISTVVSHCSLHGHHRYLRNILLTEYTNIIQPG